MGDIEGRKHRILIYLGKLALRARSGKLGNVIARSIPCVKIKRFWEKFPGGKLDGTTWRCEEKEEVADGKNGEPEIMRKVSWRVILSCDITCWNPQQFVLLSLLVKNREEDRFFNNFKTEEKEIFYICAKRGVDNIPIFLFLKKRKIKYKSLFYTLQQLVTENVWRTRQVESFQNTKNHSTPPFSPKLKI